MYVVKMGTASSKPVTVDGLRDGLSAGKITGDMQCKNMETGEWSTVLAVVSEDCKPATAPPGIYSAEALGAFSWLIPASMTILGVFLIGLSLFLIGIGLTGHPEAAAIGLCSIPVGLLLIAFAQIFSYALKYADYVMRRLESMGL